MCAFISSYRDQVTQMPILQQVYASSLLPTHHKQTDTQTQNSL